LKGDGAFHRIDHAGKLEQYTVAHHLDDPPVIGGHQRLKALDPDFLEGCERSQFIGTDQSRVARHIGG
jgi:hypothetical protein